MALEDNVLALCKEALTKRRKPVADAYQSVSKDRIEAVLRAIRSLRSSTTSTRATPTMRSTDPDDGAGHQLLLLYLHTDPLGGAKARDERPANDHVAL